MVLPITMCVLHHTDRVIQCDLNFMKQYDQFIMIWHDMYIMIQHDMNIMIQYDQYIMSVISVL